MSFDYDGLYGETPHALGPPTQRVVDLLTPHLRPAARVLDVGCGQGRDAIWLAEAGHEVTAFDPSAAGIAQLAEEAAAKGLAITAQVGDLLTWETDQSFDAVLIDRTLHMLEAEPRVTGFARLIRLVRPGGIVLVIDEAPNIPALAEVLGKGWEVLHRRKGDLLARRSA